MGTLFTLQGIEALLAKLAPWLMLALAVWGYGHAQYNAGEASERGKWAQLANDKDKEILRLNVALVTGQLTAFQSYAEKLDAREPIILHDRQTVREFAASPAGIVPCLGPERVRDIARTDRARGLDYSAATGSGDEAMYADTAADRP